jgi:hypothetical protein
VSHTAAATVPPPHDPAHLGDRELGPRHEMQHQERQRPVEGAVVEGQRAGVGVLEFEARVGAGGARGLEIELGIVDRGQRRRILPREQREGEAAGAAADVDQPLALADAGEVDEQRREPPTPAPHHLLVGGGVASVEIGWHGSVRSGERIGAD